MSINNSGINASRSLPQASPSPPLRAKKKPRRKLLIGLLLLLILLLLSSGFIAWNVFIHGTSTMQAETVVGQAFFTSSQLENDFNDQGLNDELEIDLHKISAPPSGKSYYAWLLGDKSAGTNKALLIGPLTVKHNEVQFSSKPLGSDLLQTYSRFVITEDSTNSTPTDPSSDVKRWVYSAELAQTPDPTDSVNQYSLLDHLRLLLSHYPVLQQAGLAGGLDMRFYLNMSSVLQFAGSARDYWNSKGATAIRLQMIRILDFIDGATSVQADVPPHTPVIVGTQFCVIGLLAPSPSSAQAQSSSYIDLIGAQVKAIMKAPGVTPEQHNLAVEIIAALNNISARLTKVHDDARRLVFLSDQQLLQRSSLDTLDDMQTQAFYAFAGQLDTFTNNVKDGVVQTNFAIQRLATFDIMASSTM
jgi:hypothetical protein